MAFSSNSGLSSILPGLTNFTWHAATILRFRPFDFNTILRASLGPGTARNMVLSAIGVEHDDVIRGSFEVDTLFNLGKRARSNSREC